MSGFFFLTTYIASIELPISPIIITPGNSEIIFAPCSRTSRGSSI